MDLNQENNVPFDLITKVISGEASTEEIQLAKNWRAENPENEKEYQNLVSILGNIPTDLPKVDVNAAWNKIESQIETKKKSNYWPLSIAASIAILIGLFFFNTGTSNLEVIAQSDGQIQWLPDSSKVTLKKGSKISYLENFEGELRAISLEGEAFFEVQKNPNKPFVVKAGATQVKVLGTKFNVKQQTGNTEVVVSEGKVEVKPEEFPEEKVLLTKGQIAVWDNKDKTMEQPATIRPLALYYATKTLIFKRTKVSEVVKILSTVYDTKINLACSEVGDDSYVGRFDNDPLETVIMVLSDAINATSEKTPEGNYILTNEKCN